MQAPRLPDNKKKGMVTLPPMSVSIIETSNPKITHTTYLYEMSGDRFQLPEGIILLDIVHRVDHKTQQHLNIPVLNANNVLCSIGKNMPIMSMHLAGKCDEVQEVSWNRLQCDTSKLLPHIPQNASFTTGTRY